MDLEPGLRVVSSGSDVSVATLHNLVYCHFQGETLASAAATVRRTFASLVKVHERIIFFAVIETSSIPPGEEARAAFIKLFDDFGENIAIALVTIRGEGFRSAMVRVITSGILNFVRFRVRIPKHIGSSLEEAADRAVEHAPDLNAAGILRGFSQLAAR